MPQPARYSVVVLDASGNEVLKIGRYGNVDDMKETGSTGTGTDDGICVFHPLNVAVETDRRLFVADPGNAVILSVVLEYRAVERISFGVIPVMEERRHAEKMIATPGSCGTIGGAI